MSTKFEDHLYPRGRSATEPDLIPSVKDSDGQNVLYNSSKRKTTESTVVNLGTSPNSNDGDPLRTSFGKINNFIEASYWVNESVNQKFRDIDSELREGIHLYTDSDEKINVSLLDNTKLYLRGNPNQVEVNVTRVKSANNPYDWDSEVSINFNLTETVDIEQLNINESFNIIDSDGVRRVAYYRVNYPTTYDERPVSGVDSVFEAKTNVVLGRDSDDVLIVNSRISSNLIPYGDEIYNLGDSDNKWRDLWLSGNTIHLGSIQIKNYNNKGLILVDSEGKTLNLAINEGQASTINVDSEFSVGGNTLLSGRLRVRENGQFDSDVNIAGIVYASAFKLPPGATTIIFDDPVYFDRQVTFDSDVIISQDLRVDSDVIIKGSVSIGKQTHINDSLVVTGNTILDSDVAIAGGLTVGREAHFYDDVRFYDNAQFDSDVVIAGDLIVNGTTTTLNTQNTTIKDGIITLNSGQFTPTRDAGFVFQRYDSDIVSVAQPNILMYWDESAKAFRFGETFNNGHETNLLLSERYGLMGEDFFVLYDSENAPRFVWSKSNATLKILNKDGSSAFEFDADSGEMTGNGFINGGTF